MQKNGIPIYNVSEITWLIKSRLEEDFPLVRIRGEISTLRQAASGHCYFNLKDRDALISAVLFRNQRSRLNFTPADGQSVVVLGRVTVYPQRGNYQVICETMEQTGLGDLLLMLEERKKRLTSEGLFDAALKQPLPELPSRIGVVTSAGGAALRDIINVLNRRMAGYTLLICDTLVQGGKAPEGIVRCLDRLNRLDAADVIILARGGGSMEDLLPFSDEGVVRAVSRSGIPVVTGVGHEIDFSLSDYAADVRAATPSAAAEIVSRAATDVKRTVAGQKEEILRSAKHYLERKHWQLQQAGRDVLVQKMKGIVEPRRIRVDDLKGELRQGADERLKGLRHSLQMLRLSLQAQSPESILKKGYSLVLKDDRIVTAAADLSEGDGVDLRFQDGMKHALITGEKNEEL